MIVKLGDVASYINGYAFKPSDWSDVGLPIIRIQDLTGNSYEANRYDGEYDKKYEIVAGDVLISWSASLGVYVWNGENALLNQHIFKVVFDKLTVDKNFFVYQMEQILQRASNQAHGATMKHLTKSVFDNLPFYLPELKVQQEISKRLQSVNDTITWHKELLSVHNETIRSRFLELFGNPNINPMGWDKVPLSECLINIENGRSFVCDTAKRTGENPAVLKLGAVTYGYYQANENKAMFEKSQFVASAEVHKGDLLFTRKNTPELVGMSAYVYDTPPKLMMPDLIFRLNTKPNCHKMFLWKLINLDLFRPNISALSSGSAKSMSNISKERLMGLEIILPPIELQEQFADFVMQVDEAKKAVQESLDNIEILKKALMQKYFG